MNPIFRVAVYADLDVVIAFMRSYYAFDHIRFDETAARNALRGLIGDPSLGIIWLICDGPLPVGYIVMTFGYSLEYQGRDAFVDEFFIEPGHRGRGWGSRALGYVEGAARTSGIRAIHLEVTRANTGAQALYRRLGFEDHDRYLMTKTID